MRTLAGSRTRLSLLPRWPLRAQSFQLFLPFQLWTWLSIGRRTSTSMPSQRSLEQPCSSVSRYGNCVTARFKILLLDISELQEKHFSLPVLAEQCPVLNHTSISAGSMTCTHPIAPYSYNSTCEVRCDEGYEPSGQDQIRCDHTGQWTASVPSCTSKVIVITFDRLR